MSISPLPPSYCTNVHPTRTLADIQRNLRDFARPIQQRYGRPLGAGLWFPDSIAQQLLHEPPSLLQRELSAHHLTCYTLNAFPFGDFHTDRVKQQVYQPTWNHPSRLHYTLRCAKILAALLPTDTDGSISTLPLAFKEPPLTDAALNLAMDHLIQCAQHLQQLQSETGNTIRLAIEPEPLCVLETTAETIAFSHQLRARAASQHAESAVHNHIGVCFDVCHQAVEFEPIAQSIAALERAHIRINKVHLSSAIRLPDPAKSTAARDALQQFIEPRYLHQTFAQLPGGRIARATDLNRELLRTPPKDFVAAKEWRIHFHVPIDAEQIGPLPTTHFELAAALQAIAELPYAPHLEVETYTWPVLPNQSEPNHIVGIARELAAADRLIARCRALADQGGPLIAQ